MARRNRPALPFDSRGGTLVLMRRMIESAAWLGLSAQAKALLVLLQVHWRHDVPVAYGVREAMDKIPCAKGTARRAFEELQDAGFIEVVDQSLFNSRESSKSRTWRLTWMPWRGQKPSNEWEKNESTGPRMHPLAAAQGQKCTRWKCAPTPQGQKCTL